MAVEGVPSSASRCISLRATISLVMRDLPCGEEIRCAHVEERGEVAHLEDGRIRSLA